MSKLSLVEVRRFLGEYIARDCGMAMKDAAVPAEVVIDQTRLDIEVEQDGEVGQPYMSVAFDTKTRMPVGFHIGFECPEVALKRLDETLRKATAVRRGPARLIRGSIEKFMCRVNRSLRLTPSAGFR